MCNIYLSGLGDTDAWKEEWSEEHQRKYYFHVETGNVRFVRLLFTSIPNSQTLTLVCPYVINPTDMLDYAYFNAPTQNY